MDWTERHLLDAYVFGYPLVYNVSSMQAIAAHGLGSLPPARFNAFTHATGLASPADAFVSVNNDTVYALGLLDLSGGPLLLHVPDTDGALLRAAVRGRVDEQLRLRRPPGHRDRGGHLPHRPARVDGRGARRRARDRVAHRPRGDRRPARRRRRGGHAARARAAAAVHPDAARGQRAPSRHPAAARGPARAPAVLGAAAGLEPGVPAGTRRRGLPAPVRRVRPHRPAQPLRHRRPRPRGAPRERVRRGPERRGGDVEARPVGRRERLARLAARIRLQRRLPRPRHDRRGRVEDRRPGRGLRPAGAMRPATACGATTATRPTTPRSSSMPTASS